MPDSRGHDPAPPGDPVLDRAREGILAYLEEKKNGGQIAENYYAHAVQSVVGHLVDWYTDPAIDRLSPNLKRGVRRAIEEGRWGEIVNAYVRTVAFGTGGIRALMAFDKASIVALKEKGLDAEILKGPNTLNNIVVLQSAHGVARYLADEHGSDSGGWPNGKIVVGFDSRVAGAALAKMVAELFLSERLGVYLFDEAVPYPEVTFAIPHLGADMGIFISASHNDYRYNGFKMSGPNGAQVPYKERNKILADYIEKARLEEIRPVPLEGCPKEILGRLRFLGGRERLTGVDYYGRDLIDMHTSHVEHMKGFLLRKDARGEMAGARNLKVVYSAFNGSGRRACPRILADLGCGHVHKISSLDELNGLFPAFRSDPGWEQQPDPGDRRAARIALEELKKDARQETYIPWKEADLLIGTDPDADRCGVAVRPPAPLERALRAAPELHPDPTHLLVPADDMWALVLWYRLEFERETHGSVPDADRKFIALSHTTSDMIVKVARKFGLGAMKTWVGFGWLSAGVAHAWSDEPVPRVVEGMAGGSEDGLCHRVFYDTTLMDARRKINVATLEQSNGFSILGGPPADPERQMGAGGHVRDKDGTFAALLVAEIAAYAKSRGTDLLSLLAQRVYGDPEIGLFVNYYEPDPLDGEYPGIEGDTKKKQILERTEELYRDARAGARTFAGRGLTGARKYWTGKYDGANWKGFPDEGIRLYLGSDLDHVTIRPSGTTNSLRFHVQFHQPVVGPDGVWTRRVELEQEARRLVTHLRDRIGAPRSS